MSNLIKQHLTRLFQARLAEAVADGQIIPVDMTAYAQGSPKLEALYESMAEAKRWTYDQDFHFNL
jgi:hypothetical protein